MKSGIYCIKNLLTGKVYIGSSQNLPSRRNNHFNALRSNVHHCKHLQNAYNLQQGVGFIYGVIEHHPIDGIEIKEQYWIDLYKANDNQYGYNTRLFCTSNRGYKQSDEVRRGMSKRMSERVVSEETRARMRESFKGRKLSEATKAKLRRENLSPERIERMRQANKGRISKNRLFTEQDIIDIKTSTLPSRKLGEKYKVSKTTILNILKGQVYSNIKQAPVVKIRVWRTGWNHSEETKQKMRVPKRKIANGN